MTVGSAGNFVTSGGRLAASCRAKPFSSAFDFLLNSIGAVRSAAFEGRLRDLKIEIRLGIYGVVSAPKCFANAPVCQLRGVSLKIIHNITPQAFLPAQTRVVSNLP